MKKNGDFALKILSSCKEAFAQCTKKQYFSISHLYSDEKPMEMHIHDCYEIYYSISGGKQFLIDNRFYDILPGDIFFINQYESHHLTSIDSQIHERIVFSIHPDFLKSLCTADTNLDSCFQNHSLKLGHKVSLAPEEQKRFLYYVHKFADIRGYGADLLERAAFMELMVFLNKRFQKNHQKELDMDMNCSTQVDGILSYINQHMAEPLSLGQLADHFYLSPSYLCRLFKSTTGTTINKYITAKRISYAKELLAEGYSVSDTCTKCGFNDYSNFFKAFTKATNLSPKKYAQFSNGHNALVPKQTLSQDIVPASSVASKING